MPGAPLGINKVKRIHSVNHKIKVTDDEDEHAQIDSDPNEIKDKHFLVELDFSSPEDKMKVSLEDFVVQIDDCSFKNPTCLMAEFEFEQGPSKVM